MRVFLGGTCSESTWREALIEALEYHNIDYFNPVVEDWTPEDMAEEVKQREECDICLFVITTRISGVASIAEVVDDSNKRPKKTIFCISDFDGEWKADLLKSLEFVGRMVNENGGYWVDADALIDFLSDMAQGNV